MKLHKRVIEDLMVLPGDPADLVSRSTTVTKSGWLDTKQAPGPKDLAQDDGDQRYPSCTAAAPDCTTRPAA